MEPRKRLEFYEAALIDWEKPIETARKNRTDEGFCNYFDMKHQINLWYSGAFERKFPELLKQRVTDC